MSCLIYIKGAVISSEPPKQKTTMMRHSSKKARSFVYDLEDEEIFSENGGEGGVGGNDDDDDARKVGEKNKERRRQESEVVVVEGRKGCGGVEEEAEGEESIQKLTSEIAIIEANIAGAKGKMLELFEGDGEKLKEYLRTEHTSSVFSTSRSGVLFCCSYGSGGATAFSIPPRIPDYMMDYKEYDQKKKSMEEGIKTMNDNIMVCLLCVCCCCYLFFSSYFCVCVIVTTETNIGL